jgi:hypothetical protein
MDLPKVKCQLVGLDGNAFAVMGRFQQAARKAGWPKEEIKKVLDDAMSSDYDHLLDVISSHCEKPDDE